MKERFTDKADNLFYNTGILPILGSPLGTANFVSNWTEKKVEHWVRELSSLSTGSLLCPHSWPDESLDLPLEDLPPNDVFRDLFALSCRQGGLGVPNPESLSSSQYQNSLSICGPQILSNAKTSIRSQNRQLAKLRSLLSPQSA